MATTDDITVRQMRNLLFDVSNQEMTVRELRSLLFAEDDQERYAREVILAGAHHNRLESLSPIHPDFPGQTLQQNFNAAAARLGL